MKEYNNVILKMAKVMDILGGLVLTFMMLITVLDVILRVSGRPITGTYELVFLGGAVVIGCAIPMSSWEGAQVNVDFVLMSFPRTLRKVVTVITRLFGIAFFFLLGWNLFALGTELYNKEEVSLTLHVPIYPVAYVLGICAFIECLVLVSDMVMTMKEAGHE